MFKKPIIVFEGIEGSGKTIHSNLVSSYLKKKKIDHIKLREPGGSKNSEIIRNLILNKKSDFDKKTDLLLYLAARSENISLLKKYHNKKIIIIDRFIDSTIAYQHYGFGIDLRIINQINNYLIENIKVDFTFLNVVSEQNMLIRLKKRKNLNRYDKFNKKFYSNVQKGFLRLAKRKIKSYQIINSNIDVEINKKIVLKVIDKLIK